MVRQSLGRLVISLRPGRGSYSRVVNAEEEKLGVIVFIPAVRVSDEEDGKGRAD
jgi:hypothetical protein